MCFDYDDYAEFCESKTVVCRKPHRCDGCRKVIAKGESAKYTTGKFDGEFFRVYECERCQRLTLSIAAEEIEHGCSWSQAWCALDDLSSYVAERGEPVKLLEGSLEQCWKYVNDLWQQKVADRRQLMGV